MEVKVCKNCRRLFNYIYGPEICPECIKLLPENETDIKNKDFAAPLKSIVKEEEELFEQIRDFIMAHPKATVVQIAEKHQISPTKILEWIREDRLEFSDDSMAVWFECMKCGIKIRSGRLCNRCKFR